MKTTKTKSVAKKPAAKKPVAKKPVRKAAPMAKPAAEKKVDTLVTPKMVGPITAIKDYFLGYVNFVGTSTRSQYWWAALFIVLINILVSLFRLELLSSILFAVFFIPSRALAFRRFHDAGLSGWWYLIPMMLLLVWAFVRVPMWFVLLNLNFFAPDLLAWGGLWLIFGLFCLVVFCLPSKKK